MVFSLLKLIIYNAQIGKRKKFNCDFTLLNSGVPCHNRSTLCMLVLLV